MSNRTPKANIAATAWVHKYGRLALVIVLAVIGLLASLSRNDSQYSRAIKLDNNIINVEIADTTFKQEQGLAGRKSMMADQGMLFVFDNSAKHCFWMRGMHMDLDILWFNHDKKVVYKQIGLKPSTYPRTFCPPEDSKYVLEIRSGQAEKLDLQSNSKFEFVK